MIEEQEAKEKAEQEALIEIAKKEAQDRACRFAPSVERSKSVQPNLKPLVSIETMGKFNIVASYVKKDYICAGSYPAAVLASVWNQQNAEKAAVRLIYNDIDIYHGKFGDGTIQRENCT